MPSVNEHTQAGDTRRRARVLLLTGICGLVFAGVGSAVVAPVAAGGGRAYGLLVWTVSAAVAVVALSSVGAAALIWLHSRRRQSRIDPER